jgi:hypothetical protein
MAPQPSKNNTAADARKKLANVIGAAKADRVLAANPKEWPTDVKNDRLAPATPLGTCTYMVDGGIFTVHGLTKAECDDLGGIWVQDPP